MFRVAAAEVFADEGIAAGPEAGEVARDLDGTLRGGEKVHDDGDASARYGRGLVHAEDLLDADGEVGGVLIVMYLNAGAAGNGKVGRGEVVEQAARAAGGVETAEEGRGEVDFLKAAPAGDAVAVGAEPRVEVGEERVVGEVGPVLVGEGLAQEEDAGLKGAGVFAPRELGDAFLAEDRKSVV